MKKTITSILLCIIYFYAKAQNINGISTNPLNPANPPFLPWANLNLGSGFTPLAQVLCAAFAWLTCANSNHNY
jgi:hypothetical protein